ncbi:MAG: transglycosylase SLT domain-containing protein [Gemmatimonadota bacterium]|jgi:soluble lytic murein transglycosylase-like protein
MSDRGSDSTDSKASRIHVLRESLARAEREARERAEARARANADPRARAEPDSAGNERRAAFGATVSALAQWEAEQTHKMQRWFAQRWTQLRNPVRFGVVVAAAFLLGLQVAAGSGGGLAQLEMATRLTHARSALTAREGELELVRLELSRLSDIIHYSSQYDIPADLAGAIHDIALSEGVDPALAFRLVQVESGFTRKAVSPKGAVGYTQIMPATAYQLEPGLKYNDLFVRDTNLRLGFRYLRTMLERYGDLRLALLAYNRGPGTVDSIRRGGGDPANGYARTVIRQP